MKLQIAIFYVLRMHKSKLNVLVRSFIGIYVFMMKFAKTQMFTHYNYSNVKIKVGCPIRFQRLTLRLYSDSACLYQYLCCDVIGPIL